MIVIDDGKVSMADEYESEEEYEEEEFDDGYRVQMCSVGGNIHMAQSTSQTDLLTERSVQPVTVSQGTNLLDISLDPARYNNIVE